MAEHTQEKGYMMSLGAKTEPKLEFLLMALSTELPSQCMPLIT